MLHDVGKASNTFLLQIFKSFPQVEEMIAPLTLRELADARYHHTLIGASILNELGVRDYIISIIGAHHGKTMDQPDFNESMHVEANFYGKTADRPLWRSLWKEYLTDAMEQAGYASLEEIPKEVSNPRSCCSSPCLLFQTGLQATLPFFR